ncbi:MAG: hypothetical protein F4023_00530 [Acidobacteria bacterium]|nr:hypothetical protein [Acidobacteriota bacterium]MYK78125.1 hypothetical protein [Acidobacteriota bacterium]
MPAGRMRLVASVAALVVLHLLVALAPAEPRLFGTPFGLVLELAVVGLSTLNLWLAVRILLPGAEAGDPAGGAGTSD